MVEDGGRKEKQHSRQEQPSLLVPENVPDHLKASLPLLVSLHPSSIRPPSTTTTTALRNLNPPQGLALIDLGYRRTLKLYIHRLKD
jgi:hypothetical protein